MILGCLQERMLMDVKDLAKCFIIQILNSPSFFVCGNVDILSTMYKKKLNKYNSYYVYHLFDLPLMRSKRWQGFDQSLLEFERTYIAIFDIVEARLRHGFYTLFIWNCEPLLCTRYSMTCVYITLLTRLVSGPYNNFVLNFIPIILQLRITH